MGSKRKSKPGRSRKKTKANADQALALDYVRTWAQPAPPPASDSAADDFLPAQAARSGDVLFELHSHSNHSDGSLSPSALVERAHRNGVSRALCDLFRLPGNCSMKCLDCLIAAGVQV
jgi:3',5'-nucleoside bisphosphate phosphatase